MAQLQCGKVLAPTTAKPAGLCRLVASRPERKRCVPAVAAVKEIFMPALSSTMTEGKIVSWLKSPGDKVSKGESVVSTSPRLVENLRSANAPDKPCLSAILDHIWNTCPQQDPHQFLARCHDTPCSLLCFLHG